MNKTRVKINVNNIEINVMSDENESYIHCIASEVDEAVRKIKLENPGLPQSICDILVMMDFCDKAHKVCGKLNKSPNAETKKLQKSESKGKKINK